MVFVEGGVGDDALAGAWSGGSLPLLDFTCCMLTYLFFSLLVCGCGWRWWADHAKVYGAGLELVIVQSENDVSGSSSGVGGGHVGGFVEHVLGTCHDGGVHGDVLECVEESVPDAVVQSGFGYLPMAVKVVVAEDVQPFLALAAPSVGVYGEAQSPC
eukprot:scaffold189111_cov50-Attheya_sp.AAC.3